MPALTRWFVKASLVWLVLALVAGIVQQVPGVSIPGLFPVYMHLLTFGWLTQLIFGIALWMFPKFSHEQPRGPAWLGWTAFITLNAGLILRIVFEPLHAGHPAWWSAWMLILAAVLQWLSGIAFFAIAWRRVRGK